MKLLTSLALILGSLSFSGCVTVAEPSIGMTEKRWLLNTVLSNMVYAEGNITAYRANRQYYYFRDGLLVKIDPDWISSQKIGELEGPGRKTPPSAPSAPTASAAPSAPTVSSAPAAHFDTYTELKKLDELRKEKIITEEEFQAQKKKILDRKE